MKTALTSSHRRSARPTRAAAIALVAGVGFALTPTAAVANVASASAATAVAAPALSQVAARSPAAQIAVNTALAQVGKPYRWGGAGPSSFDCSGLTQFAYGAAGVRLPHSSRMQSTIGVPVGLWSLQPGDLLFYYSPVSHVTMYIGDGMMVHASTSGQPVKVVWAGSMPGFVGARRVA